MPFHAKDRPAPTRSRIPAARRFLPRLRRLRDTVALSYTRATDDVERHWLRSLADDLDRQILAGEAVLGGFADPREVQRVRKRTREEESLF
jgi:phytoene dehydrogenase-like protein